MNRIFVQYWVYVLCSDVTSLFAKIEGKGIVGPGGGSGGNDGMFYLVVNSMQYFLHFMYSHCTVLLFRCCRVYITTLL